MKRARVVGASMLEREARHEARRLPRLLPRHLDRRLRRIEGRLQQGVDFDSPAAEGDQPFLLED